MLDIIVASVITAIVFFLLGRYTHKLKVRRIQKERLQTFEQRNTELIRNLPDVLLPFGDFSEEEIKSYSETLEFHRENLSGTCLCILNSLLSCSKDNISEDDIRHYFDILKSMIDFQSKIFNVD